MVLRLVQVEVRSESGKRGDGRLEKNECSVCALWICNPLQRMRIKVMQKRECGRVVTEPQREHKREN